MIRIFLDGEWKLKHFVEGKAKIKNPDSLDAISGEAVPAYVPGNVELDLMRAGKLPDIYFGDNVHLLRPLEFHEWWYRRTFIGPTYTRGQRIYLVFEGLDCFATIWLNGKRVGKTDNMFIAHRFEVTKLIRPGETNDLAVRLGSAVNAARAHMPDPCEAHLPTNWEQLAVRKAPHMYGWDIAPRIVSAGIWRSVVLEIWNPTELVDLYYWTRRADPETAELGVSYHFITDARELDGFRLRFSGACGDSHFETEFPASFVSGQANIIIRKPRLWWPKGYGEPNLYRVTCELFHKDKLVASRTDTIGLRTVILRRTEVTDERGGEFRFEVNGVPILVKGANSVPLDAFHSRDARRVVPVLSLFDDLGCNMIRCWGGNVYEDHPFFDFCDAHGIMVWQDFAFACMRPPQTEEFLESVRREAEAVVRKLRNHPSLVLWCGDNECDAAYQWAGLGGFHNRVTREVLPQVVARCDPWRPYLPSSPYLAPLELSRNDPRRLPEQHLWGKREYYKSPFYTETTAHFISEVGYHGCPNVSTLRRFLDEQHLWPWQDNSQWITHSTDSTPGGGPYKYRVKLMSDQIKYLFNFEPQDIYTFALASQIVQAEALKFFVEMVRLKKWRRTGILWWNVIDCWPQFSDSVVDYFYTKKLAYYYLRRVHHPVCIMVDEPADGRVRVVAGNDSNTPASGEYRVWDADSDQTLLEGKFHTEANINCDLGHIPVSPHEHRLFLITWTLGARQFGNHYLLGKPPISFERYREWLKAIADLPGGFYPEGVAK